MRDLTAQNRPFLLADSQAIWNNVEAVLLPAKQVRLPANTIRNWGGGSRRLPPKRTSPTITKLLNALVGVMRGSNAKMDCEL